MRCLYYFNTFFSQLIDDTVSEMYTQTTHTPQLNEKSFFVFNVKEPDNPQPSVCYLSGY